MVKFKLEHFSWNSREPGAYAKKHGYKSLGLFWAIVGRISRSNTFNLKSILLALCPLTIWNWASNLETHCLDLFGIFSSPHILLLGWGCCTLKSHSWRRRLTLCLALRTLGGSWPQPDSHLFAQRFHRFILYHLNSVEFKCIKSCSNRVMLQRSCGWHSHWVWL